MGSYEKHYMKNPTRRRVMLTWKPIKGTITERYRYYVDHCPEVIKKCIGVYVAGTTTNAFDVEVVAMGKLYAIVKQPGGVWYDNGGRHYTSPWYELIRIGVKGYSTRIKTVWEVEKNGRLTKKERTRLMQELIDFEG